MSLSGGSAVALRAFALRRRQRPTAGPVPFAREQPVLAKALAQAVG